MFNVPIIFRLSDPNSPYNFQTKIYIEEMCTYRWNSRERKKKKHKLLCAGCIYSVIVYAGFKTFLLIF